ITEALPEIRFNSRWQNPSLIKQSLRGADTEFDTVLMGTSMGQNFIPSELQSALGSGRVLKLNMPGSLPEMDLLVMEMVLQSPNVRRVLWEISPHYSRVETTSLSQMDTFPLHLYGDGWTDLTRTLFSADTTRMSLRSLTNGHQTLEYDNWNTWYIEDQWSEWREAQLLERLPALTGKVLSVHPRTEPILCRSEEGEIEFGYPIIDRVAELIRQRPDVEFDFFFPPRSALYYAQIEEDLDRLLEMEPHFVRRLTGPAGVDVHGFGDVGEIVLDLNHYKDEGHYGPEINRWMAKAIGERTHRLTPETIERYQKQRIDHIRRVIAEVHDGSFEVRQPPADRPPLP
ncbi:MAG: hypothetical protein VX641_04230, partial [Planctomycetota bacterium]|nr:hypothetical protein [Planctomycetota bacterium]